MEQVRKTVVFRSHAEVAAALDDWLFKIPDEPTPPKRIKISEHKEEIAKTINEFITRTGEGAPRKYKRASARTNGVRLEDIAKEIEDKLGLKISKSSVRRFVNPNSIRRRNSVKTQTTSRINEANIGDKNIFYNFESSVCNHCARFRYECLCVNVVRQLDFDNNRYGGINVQNGHNSAVRYMQVPWYMQGYPWFMH